MIFGTLSNSDHSPTKIVSAEGSECRVIPASRSTSANGHCNAVGVRDHEWGANAGPAESGGLVVGRSVKNRSLVFDCWWVSRSNPVLPAYPADHGRVEIRLEIKVSVPLKLVHRTMSLAWPVRQCCWLLLVSLATLIVLIVPAAWLAGWSGIQGLGLSAVVCLIPGLLTVALVGSVKDPVARVWLTVGGMVVRMFVILIVALIVHQLRPKLGLIDFYIWLIVFYNVLLLAETWLLLPRSSSEA